MHGGLPLQHFTIKKKLFESTMPIFGHVTRLHMPTLAWPRHMSASETPEGLQTQLRLGFFTAKRLTYRRAANDPSRTFNLRLEDIGFSTYCRHLPFRLTNFKLLGRAAEMPSKASGRR